MSAKKRVTGVGMAAAAAGLAVAASAASADLVVSRIGDGAAALSNASALVFLDRFTTAGAPTGTWTLPGTALGANRAFTLSGSATSEGFLTLSSNGQYLTIGGYDSAPGVGNIAATATSAVNRVIARIDNLGVADTSTALSDLSFSGSNIRSVASTDGVQFWAAGTAGTGANGGVRYTTYGSNASVQLSSTPTNVRVSNIFAGQLYVSSASGTFQGVSTVGSGLPTTTGQTTTGLAGMPTAAGPSSYDYFFASSSVLYVADDRSVTGGGAGGLQKWVLSGGAWSLAYTLNANLTAGLRGLCGEVDGLGNVTLYATTADTVNATTGNKLVSVTDTGAGSAFTVLAVAAPNTAFRGVDFAPIPAPGAMALLGAAGVLAARRRR